MRARNQWFAGWSGMGDLDIAAAILPADTFANRPAAAPWNKGFLFTATDTGAMYRSDGTTWSATGGGSNALLDGSTHTDTVAATVSRGSLIYGNSTPKWDELTIGAANALLGSDGTDVSWFACTAAGRALLDDATAADQRTTLGVGTGDSPQFTAVNIGDASDTTVTRVSAGVIAVEGSTVLTGAGSTAITTLGTISTGTWNGTAITAAYIGALNGFTDADPALADVSPIYDDSASANRDTTLAKLGGMLDPTLCTGRLTLTSGTPVTTSDVTSAQTLYFGLAGTRVSHYDATRWTEYSLSAELSLPLDQQGLSGTVNVGFTISGLADTSQMVRGMEVSGTGIAGTAKIASIDSASQITLDTVNTSSGAASNIRVKLPTGKNYDVWLVVVSGTPKLQFGNAWSGDTSRADALTTQDGVYVNNAAINSTDSNTIAAKCGKLLGTIRTSAAGATEDSDAKRFVANLYNAVPRRLFTCPAYNNGNTNTSYTLSSTTTVAFNGGTANKVEFVLPLAGVAVDATAHILGVPSTSSDYLMAGLCVDTTTSLTYATQLSGQQTHAVRGCHLFTTPGYHYYSLSGYRGAGNATIYSDLSRSGDTADPYTTFVIGWVMG